MSIQGITNATTHNYLSFSFSERQLLMTSKTCWFDTLLRDSGLICCNIEIYQSSVEKCPCLFINATCLGNFFVHLCGVGAFRVRVLAGDHFQQAHAKGINVDLLGVTPFLIHFWGHKLGRPDKRILFIAEPHIFCSSHIANLDLIVRTVDKYVVAFDISVDDRWVVTMQVSESFEDLTAPSFYDFRIRQTQFPDILSKSLPESTRLLVRK